MGEIIARYTRVLQEISDGEHRRMACGDMRIATLLTARGFVTLVDPKHREFTTAYRITAVGTNELEDT